MRVDHIASRSLERSYAKCVLPSWLGGGGDGDREGEGQQDLLEHGGGVEVGLGGVGWDGGSDVEGSTDGQAFVVQWEGKT